jgi:hypothetical protein
MSIRHLRIAEVGLLENAQPNRFQPSKPASYTAANGVVHDNVTCLDWQQVESPSSYSNADAAFTKRARIGF